MWGAPGEAPQQLTAHKAECTALAFAPKSGRLASGSQDTGVLVWEPHRDSRPVGYAFMDDSISGVAWQPSGDRLVALDQGGGVACFEVA